MAQKSLCFYRNMNTTNYNDVLLQMELSKIKNSLNKSDDCNKTKTGITYKELCNIWYILYIDLEYLLNNVNNFEYFSNESNKKSSFNCYSTDVPKSAMWNFSND